MPPLRSRSASPSPAIDVFKFGGASLADAAAVRHAIALILEPRPSRVVTVVSALAGVTDALLALAESARAGDVDAVDEQVTKLHNRHAVVATGIIGNARVRARLLRVLDAAVEELRTLGYGVASLRELTPRTRDFLLVRGEQLSARLVVAGLLARGANAAYVEAATLIRTDGVFGGAFPDLVATDREVRAQLRPLLRQCCSHSRRAPAFNKADAIVEHLAASPVPSCSTRVCISSVPSPSSLVSGCRALAPQSKFWQCCAKMKGPYCQWRNTTVLALC